MNDYVTIVGADNYYGSKIFNVGQKVTLIKDYRNTYDEEAIKAEIETLSTVGYVANSINTVAKGTKSAGRIYDTFEDVTYGVIRFVVKDVAIVEVMKAKKDIEMGNLLFDESENFEDFEISDISIVSKDRNIF